MKNTLLAVFLLLSFNSYAQFAEGERSGNTADIDEMVWAMVFPGYTYETQSCYYLQAASQEVSKYVCEDLYFKEYLANINPNYLPLTLDQTKVVESCCPGLYFNPYK